MTIDNQTIRDQNYKLIDEHNQSTKYCSVFHHMKDVSTTYKQIIEKGEDIVPDILLYLEKEEFAGMSVMMLLWDILGHVEKYEPEQMKNDQGEKTGFVGFNVLEVKQAWIDWGKENGYL